MAGGSILAIDQGTTSTRAIVFDLEGGIRATAQRELPQIFPDDGWVEHDPEEIWRAVLAVCREVLAKAGDVAGIGITNQRETTVIWDRATGRPIHNAIVWQDRRGAALCRKLEAEGHGPLVQRLTGLLFDPYFSATKLGWLLENVPGAPARASMPPTPPTPRARCFSTSIARPGARSCWRCSASRVPCCPRCVTPPPS